MASVETPKSRGGVVDGSASGLKSRPAPSTGKPVAADDRPSIVEAIRKKREGEELTNDEIDWFIQAATKRLITDAQIGAMLMAICLRGMTDAETARLTDAMIESGHRLNYPADWKGLVVGKHSTGGVGDKVSIVLVPALAACGLKVPKMSGRGLGHTGGTLDKMESIPGYKVYLSADEILRVVGRVGCCLVGQTDEIAPADKLLYAVRDTTATTESIPLIAASVMCKKAAEGLDALCLEVTFGKAALVKTRQQAEKLAKVMLETGRRLGIKTTAVLVCMDNVLGQSVGNALEIIEAVQCLRGVGPPHVTEVVCRTGGILLWHTGKAVSPEDGSDKLKKVLNDGSAAKTFRAMLEAQGVTPGVASKLVSDEVETVLPRASHVTNLRCPKSGFVTAIDAYVCGTVAHSLGSGRLAPGDPIDYSTGIKLVVTIGSKVNKEVHHNTATVPVSIVSKLESALVINDAAPPMENAIIAVVD